jgi:hypothetical protein
VPENRRPQGLDHHLMVHEPFQSVPLCGHVAHCGVFGAHQGRTVKRNRGRPPCHRRMNRQIQIGAILRAPCRGFSLPVIGAHHRPPPMATRSLPGSGAEMVSRARRPPASCVGRQFARLCRTLLRASSSLGYVILRQCQESMPPWLRRVTVWPRRDG